MKMGEDVVATIETDINESLVLEETETTHLI
jgi:hypothetical protein